MFFQRIKTPGLAQISYILAEDGKAIVVDPARDTDRVLDILHGQALTLLYVVETHRQEDFEMGGAALRALTGARIVAYDHDIMSHADVRLRDGKELEVTPGLRLRALHTPGHTPESACYAVTLGDVPDRTWGVFTGDSLFIGDTGRTDLTDAARTAENAGLLYDAVHARVLTLGDEALVLPAHGAGSACGGNVADRDHSTIGMEKAGNKVAVLGRDGFIAHKCAERLARPPYFRHMENVNLMPGRPMEERPLPWLAPDDFAVAMEDAIVIDTREVEAFAGGHVPGSYSIWRNGLAPYGGWVAGPESRILLIASDTDAATEARLALARLGLDGVAGALAGGFDAWRNGGHPIATLGTLSAAALVEHLQDVTVLDVREVSEFEDGHIPGARHCVVGHLEDRLGRLALPRDAPIAVTCSVGHRGSLGASILARHGHRAVFNLLGGMTAWKALGLETEKRGG